jgi:DNA-directed RNA polymerase subunit RPC12/RpoP
MPIRLTCPGCQHTLNAPDDSAGEEVVCGNCRRKVLVPPSAATPASVGSDLAAIRGSLRWIHGLLALIAVVLLAILVLMPLGGFKPPSP